MRDPLKGWARKDGALAGTFSFQYAVVGGAGLGLKLGEVVQAGVAAQVAGRVDDGLDPHRPAVFEVLLDPRVLVEQVEHDAAGVRADDRPVDGGAEDAGGVAADAAVEDDLDVGGAADVEVVGDQGLEERPGPAGASNTRVRETSTWRMEISHQYPARWSARAEGQREPVQPPLGEHLDGARLQPVADRLQRGRILAGRRTRWTAR